MKKEIIIMKILMYIGIFACVIILIEEFVFLITINIFDFKPSTYENTDTIICKLQNEEHKFMITYNHLYKINKISSFGSINYEDIVGKNVLGNNVKNIEENIIEFFDKDNGQCNITTEGPINR